MQASRNQSFCSVPSLDSQRNYMHARYTAAPMAAPAAAEPPLSWRKKLLLKQEPLWEVLRVKLRQRYIAAQLRVADLYEAGCVLPGSSDIERWCKLSACSSCGCPHLQCLRKVPVLYATSRGCVYIDVPLYQCSVDDGGCGGVVHALPTDADCFPGDPSKAVQLSSWREAEPAVVWLDRQLLELYYRIMMGSPETSEQSFAAAVSQLLAEFRPAAALSATRLQAILGNVFHEYLIFKVQMDDMSLLGCNDYPVHQARP